MHIAFRFRKIINLLRQLHFVVYISAIVTIATPRHVNLEIFERSVGCKIENVANVVRHHARSVFLKHH